MINTGASARVVSVVILEPNLFFIAACLPACSSLAMEVVQRPSVRRLLHLSELSNENPYSTPYQQRSRRAVKASDDVERLVEGRTDNLEDPVSPRKPDYEYSQVAMPLKAISKRSVS